MSINDFNLKKDNYNQHMSFYFYYNVNTSPYFYSLKIVLYDFIKKYSNNINNIINKIVDNNSFIPLEYKDSYIKAFLYFFEKDNETSIQKIIPLLEVSVKHLCISSNISPYKTVSIKGKNNDFVGIKEDTNNLDFLLKQLKDKNIINSDLFFNFYNLFYSDFSCNLRNKISHGEIKPWECNQLDIFYAIMFIIKICYFDSDDSDNFEMHKQIDIKNLKDYSDKFSLITNEGNTDFECKIELKKLIEDIKKEKNLFKKFKEEADFLINQIKIELIKREENLKLHEISYETDVTCHVNEHFEKIKDNDPLIMFEKYLKYFKFANPQSIEEYIKTISEVSCFDNLFNSEILNNKNLTIDILEPATNEDFILKNKNYDKNMSYYFKLFLNEPNYYVYSVVLYNLINECQTSLDLIINQIINNSSFIPMGYENSYKKAFLLFFEKDFETSLQKLIPLFEASIKHLCILNKIPTYEIDNGKIKISMLGHLLKELREHNIIDENMYFNFENLFNSNISCNLRNKNLHGLMSPDQYNSLEVFYAIMYIILICYVCKRK